MTEKRTLCDRCKQPITYNGWTAIIKFPKIKKGTYWKIVEILNGNPSGYDYCDMNTELCADCTEQLKKWLKGVEEQGENTDG